MRPDQSESFAPLADGEPSISAQLAAFGITHEPGPHSRRYLFREGAALGLANAQEACALLDALNAARAAQPES